MMPAGMVPMQTLRRMKIVRMQLERMVQGTCERDAESAVKPDNTLVHIRVSNSANNGLEWHSCS